MAAGILVRIIGVLYRSPVTSIIGDEGNGYYSIAYNIYAMVLLISSYSIPMAVSKVVSGKLALKQYKEAHKVFRCALIYVLIVEPLPVFSHFLARPFSFRTARPMLYRYSECWLRLSSSPVFWACCGDIFRRTLP